MADNIQFRINLAETKLASLEELLQNKSKFDNETAQDLLKEINLQTDYLQLEKNVDKTTIRNLKKKLRTLTNECQWKLTENNNARKELLDGIKPTPIPSTNEQLMNHGTEVQQETKASLERSKQVLANTHQLAVETARKVEENTETIIRINENLDVIDDTTNRSDKIIARIARKVLTDKYVCCLIWLIIIAIAFILLFKYGVFDMIHR